LCIAKGLCFFFFVAFEKANPIRGHQSFFEGAAKTANPIGGQKGCVFAFLGVRNSKSNTRAEGLCFCFFGVAKKAIPRRTQLWNQGAFQYFGEPQTL